MKYDIYQINFNNEEVNKINSRNPDFQVIYEAYLDTQFGKTQRALELKLYKKVAEIEAYNLDHVFEIGNIGPDYKITRLDKMHSISVGDIIIDEDGAAFAVARFGFDPIEYPI